jgi:hypothetical protein
MYKLDRLGWAAGFSFLSYGVRVGVRTNRPEVIDTLAGRIPPGSRLITGRPVERLFSVIIGGVGQKANVRRFNLLYTGAQRLARTLDPDEFFDTFESHVKLCVAETARRRMFVHAGVVGWKGSAIVIPGRSFSGKTSLVAELVRAGATYYSDEYAVLDERGRVHPYLRPLAIREKELGGRQKSYTAEALGGTSGSKPLPVGLVVVTKYQPGARWRPRRISAGKGALALLDNTVAARRLPGKMLAALQHIAPHATFIKGVRGEASEVAESLLRAATL